MNRTRPPSPGLPSAFGLSYFVRPIGAIVLGAYTDRAGRKAAMLVSIVLMTIETALMAEIFPIQTRGTGMALSCNVGVPPFGGLAPLIVAWLIAATGSNLAPRFYLIATSVFSLAVLVAIRVRL